MEKITALANKLKENMVVSEDKSIITVSAKGITEALKDCGVKMEDVDKVHEATKTIFNASLKAAGEIAVEDILTDENLPEDHSVVFQMNHFQSDSFVHTFSKEEGSLEIHSIYNQELEGDNYSTISETLKQNFKVSL